MTLCAVPAAAAPACLQRTRTFSFAAQLGGRSVIVTDRSRQKFKVGFAGPCAALDHSEQLGFQTMEQSRLACVERGDALVSLRDTGMDNLKRSCVVREIAPYTPEMEKADAVAKAMDRNY
ncbi:MAG TPA: DUF6491 family protein [Rhizomicrobium sp.]|nr:DUF6491 family protein [Rhizomicrobium sp.]